MALYYETQYRLGRRGGHVRRSYTGLRAFAAIVLDLVFGLLFELVSSVIALALRLVVLTVHLVIVNLKIIWRMAVAIATLLVYILTLPFALLHQAIVRLKSPVGGDTDDPYRDAPRKPEWAFSREV